MASLTTLVNFNGQDGEDPSGKLVADQEQDLFGFVEGGVNDSLYEIPFVNGSYASAPTTIVTLPSSLNAQGLNPDLAIDGQDDLFGTVLQGGLNGLGGVYEVANTGSGYAATPTTIASFNGSDGDGPVGGMIVDAAGNLFGTAQTGGASGDGTVFEITKTNGTYSTTPTALVSFDLATGVNPAGGLAMDASGDLFGTTQVAGPGGGAGTVFEIVKSNGTYADAPTILVTFNGATLTNSAASGLWPGIAMDSAGDLFGMSQESGTNIGIGVIYEIVKSNGTYSSTPTILTQFSAKLASSIENGLTVDAAGDIFGTLGNGGDNNDGAIFELVKSDGTYESAPTILTSFNQTNGAFPDGTLIGDAEGNLIGTTNVGGPTASEGTVFEVSGTGFQPPPCYVEGTVIATPAGLRPIESLGLGDPVLAHGGEVHPIVWMGHRHVICRSHPKPSEVWPVRVCGHALGEGRPWRTLWLSPDHSVFIDDVLIPIRCLVNGSTIVQEQRDEVTYWHIELDHHDVILADGLPAETYLDTGNRGAFGNGSGPVMMHPDFARGAWEAKAFARQILGGPPLILAQRRVQAQALLLGRACDQQEISKRLKWCA